MNDYIEDSNCGKSQSHSLSICSFSEIAYIEESYFALKVEEGSLCVYQAHISPEYLQEHTNPSLLLNDEKDEQSTTIIPLQCHQS